MYAAFDRAIYVLANKFDFILEFSFTLALAKECGQELRKIPYKRKIFSPQMHVIYIE